jgi:hypothetical protein
MVVQASMTIRAAWNYRLGQMMKTERVRNIMRSEPRNSIQDTSAGVGISAGSVHSILHKDLNMRDLCRHLDCTVFASEYKNEQE